MNNENEKELSRIASTQSAENDTPAADTVTGLPIDEDGLIDWELPNYDDLEFQVELGGEFVFCVDGVAGQPTTAIVTPLTNGNYRADVLAGGLYPAQVVEFSADDAEVYYHSIRLNATPAAGGRVKTT